MPHDKGHRLHHGQEMRLVARWSSAQERPPGQGKTTENPSTVEETLCCILDIFGSQLPAAHQDYAQPCLCLELSPLHPLSSISRAASTAKYYRKAEVSEIIYQQDAKHSTYGGDNNCPFALTQRSGRLSPSGVLQPSFFRPTPSDTLPSLFPPSLSTSAPMPYDLHRQGWDCSW